MPLHLDEPQAVVRTPVRAVRLAERVVVTGGLPGCGKTMLTPIVSSFERVEIQKFDYALEHVCGLRLLGALDAPAATVLIRLLTDTDLYHLAMGRETNVRPGDLSSIFRNPGTLQYLARLVGPGDAAAVERIRRDRPMLHLTVHNALAISRPLFEALDDALRILEVVRHPLYMMRQWRRYVDRYGTDGRDLTIWFDWHGQALPFFAKGWEDRYLASCPMDRTIFAIEHLLDMGQQVLSDLPAACRARVLRIPFESFVLNPSPWLVRMEQVLGTRRTRATPRELRHQRVPRQRVADGVPLSIYRECGWQPSQPHFTERQELLARRHAAEAEATPEGLRVLDRLCEDYETRYWNPDD